MTRENVDTVRAMWDAFLGDHPVSGLAFCDAEIEWDGTNLPDGKVARGHEAVIEHAMHWAEMWDDWKLEPEQFVAVGEDRVVMVLRETGRSDSGLHMDERHAEIYALRDGKIVYRKGFSDPREAFEAVGLSPPPPAHP
jgi:ketosteroid isomerase-like protein